jgi:outer membrane immunogenic protein
MGSWGIFVRKQFCLAVAAALMMSPAVAADVAPRSVVKAAVSGSYNWIGFYAGLNAGYAWNENSGPGAAFSDPAPVWGLVPIATSGGYNFPDLSPRGFVGGGQIGYDHQWGSVVAGLVADFQWADVSDSASSFSRVVIAGSPTTTDFNSLELDMLGTVRAKLGIANNNWLIYGTGGVAYGHVKSSINSLGNFPGVGIVAFTGSNSEWQSGWTLGAGFSYGIGNWVIGIEYLHYDLGLTAVTGVETANAFAGVAGRDSTITVDQKVAGDIVRGSISYRF